MTLADLIRDETTGMTSHSKLAAIIGFLAATIVFVRVCWNATPSDGLAWLFLVYMGTAAGNQVASKLMGLKWGGKNGERGETARRKGMSVRRVDLYAWNWETGTATCRPGQTAAEVGAVAEQLQPSSRIDLIILRWDGTEERRRGVTADELRDVAREMGRLSNVQPMEFSEPVKKKGGA